MIYVDCLWEVGEKGLKLHYGTFSLLSMPEYLEKSVLLKYDFPLGLTSVKM